MRNFPSKFFTLKSLQISCFAFFLLRIFLAIIQHSNIHSVEDFAIAQNLVNGLGLTYIPSVGATALKAPIYPFFLSLFILLFGSFSKLAIVLFQYALFASLPILIQKIGAKLHSEKIGFVSAYLFILTPAYFFYPNVIESTSLFVPLFITWLYCSVCLYKSATKSKIILTGLLSGLLVLTQPIVFPLIIAFLGLLIKKNQTKHALLIALLSISIVAPWTIRNYLTFNQFVAVKSPFWMNIYMGYLPENNGSQKYSVITAEDIHITDSLRGTVNDVVIEKHFKNLVTKTILSNPALYFQKTLAQAGLYWWVVPRYLNDNSIQFLLTRKIPVIILNVLTAIGLILLYKENKKLALTIIFVLLYFTAVYAFTCVANTKYKLDIEWLQLFPASLPIIKIFKL